MERGAGCVEGKDRFFRLKAFASTWNTIGTSRGLEDKGGLGKLEESRTWKLLQEITKQGL